MGKIKTYNFILIVIAVVLFSTIIYIKTTTDAYHKGRYNIRLMVHAPDSIPVLLAEAKLITADGERLEIDRTNEPMLLSRYNYNDAPTGYIRIPERMEITWFSHKYNAFYSGTFNLPKDIITALFKNVKITYPDMPIDIDLIIKPDNTIEAAVDYDKVFGTYRPKQKAYSWPWKINRQTEVDATLADDVIEPVFIKESKSVYTSIDIQLYNGGYFSVNTYNQDTKKLLQLVNNRITDTLPAGIPKYVTIGTATDTTLNNRRELYIEFDLKEITDTYTTLKNKYDNKYDLLLYLNDKDSLTGIKINNTGKSIPLKKYNTNYSY